MAPNMLNTVLHGEKPISSSAPHPSCSWLQRKGHSLLPFTLPNLKAVPIGEESP